MAGMVSGKEYSWKDSNLSLFGSDGDRSVKKESALTEVAWKPVANLNSEALLVWRIKQFKLEPVDPEDLGKFYSGDSYIILKVEKHGEALNYDAHFWIGKNSTADEYGTAAYKTVELDTFLDDKAVQHREVDDNESLKFKSYFKEFMKLEGGYQSGFNHVKPEEFKPRLLLYHGLTRTSVELSEVPFSKRSINSDDVFILDLGTTAYQWNGLNASKDEKFKASQFLQALESSRNGRCKTEVIDEHDKIESARFMSMLPDNPIQKKPKKEIGKKGIYKLSDKSGKLEVSQVCEGSLSRNALNENDPFFIDTGESLFVYIGDGCSRNEKLNALSHAHDYLKKTNHPLAPITVVSGNRKSKEMEKIWD